MWIWDAKLFAVLGWVFALASLVMVPVGLISGFGLRTLAFPLCAAWWVVFARYWANVAKQKVRSAELRKRRLARRA